MEEEGRKEEEGEKHQAYSVLLSRAVVCVVRCAAVMCCSDVLQWCTVACVVACAAMLCCSGVL